MTTKSNNNVIIVTGASRGIGAAISHHFAERGWCVIAAARNTANVDASADGDRCVVPVEVDVIDAGAVEQLFHVAAEHGPVELVVNNAGTIDPIARIEDSDPGAWASAVDVNLKGAFYVLREAVRVMKPLGGGTIITISSGAANAPMEGWSHYCTTKAAVQMLTRCADKEHRQHGIRALGLSPGTVATDMQASIKSSGINPVSKLPDSAHIPPAWVAKSIEYLHEHATEDDLGNDFSIKTDQGRDRVGLPRS
ncbi:SDR family oxidoreductase [Abyssibacter profundi]|uniref:Short-chain dehydrogenase n=1 Tax=Abyssibacter profundi TaxID=2182787 RepID=A0A363UJC6_9GAMM|nr:SDR family oxidoreductase [Abyssibacter profundi]PWN55525.1 short-chain dehydrogenase [Abyssibacter profundi]